MSTRISENTPEPVKKRKNKRKKRSRSPLSSSEAKVARPASDPRSSAIAPCVKLADGGIEIGRSCQIKRVKKDNLVSFHEIRYNKSQDAWTAAKNACLENKQGRPPSSAKADPCLDPTAGLNPTKTTALFRATSGVTCHSVIVAYLSSRLVRLSSVRQSSRTD